MAVRYSPYNETLWANPWPVYKQMQDEAPAYYIEDLDCWALSRFDDIWQASMDRTAYTAVHGTSPDALFLASETPPEVFLFMDPPEHAKHRNLIARSYLKDKVALLEEHVREVVRKLMKPRYEAGQFEIYELASLTALEIIAAFVGLHLDEVMVIRGFINRYYTREPGIRGTTESGAQAFGKAHAYILALIQKYRANPPAEHSHIASWLRAAIDERTLTDEQIFFNIFAMVITGSDTLPLTTAGCIYYLHANPDQLKLVRSDISLAANAFEEAARFDHPTNLLGRRIVKDVEMHGQKLLAGQSVLFLYAAACRDEREFSDADTFDIQRRQSRNLSFGTGLHFCLGQHLARLEGKVLIEEIIGTVPDFALEPSRCSRIRGEFLQGFHSVPISFDSR